MAFRLFPISAFPATVGKVYPDVIPTTDNSFWIEGLGVMASLDADAELHYVYHVPTPIPSGTGKLEVIGYARQAAGDAKFNPKWRSLAVGEDLDLAAGGLNAEGTDTLTWLNEKQLVTLTGASGGTFTLSFDGQGPTTTIAWNAADTAVQAALEGLSNIASGDVAVTGSAGGPWTVEFKQAYEGVDVAMMTADSGGLTGTTPTADVTLSQGSTDNHILRTKVTLDADTLTADEFIVLRLVMETTSWTLSKRSIWLPSIIWE